jgi:hypothetical protein
MTSIYECNICKNTFRTLSSLNNHKKNAKYCLIINNKESIEYYKNEYEKLKYINLNYELEIKNLNKQICEFKNNQTIIELEFQNKEYKSFITKLEQLNKGLEETLQKERKEYQEQIKEITMKLIDKSNNITNNNYNNSKNTNTTNTKIDIFNQLSPLTEDDYKKHINNLTLDHIKKGAEGYADYALNYTLKDKLMCLDYARKKICYKNEQGDKVEEYRLNNILPKIFKEIEPVNKEMILTLMNNLNDDFLEYEKTITEFDEGDETDREYSKKIEENQEQIMKYSDILGDCYKISNGITNNKLGTEITDIVINKIPKK